MLGSWRVDPDERKADALAKLEAIEATCGSRRLASGAVHLIPMTHTWNGTQVVLATNRCAYGGQRHCNPRVRLALGETRIWS